MLYDLEKRRKRESFNQGFWDEFTNRDVFEDFPLSGRRTSLPAVNVIENDKEYILELASPGMCKENYTIQLENDVLTISGRLENADKNLKYTRWEFYPSSFQRSFLLPDTVNSDEIAASCSDGILTIHIPKMKETAVQKRRTINVK